MLTVTDHLTALACSEYCIWEEFDYM